MGDVKGRRHPPLHLILLADDLRQGREICRLHLFGILRSLGSESHGQFLRPRRIHRCENRRHLARRHHLGDTHQNVDFELIEDACSVLGFHRLIHGDDGGELLFFKPLALFDQGCDLRFEGLERGCPFIGALFGGVDERGAQGKFLLVGFKFGTTRGQTIEQDLLGQGRVGTADIDIAEGVDNCGTASVSGGQSPGIAVS